jgi:hypothetical protein
LKIRVFFEHPRQQSVLNRTHEKEIIQAKDERERATHEDVLHSPAPALKVYAVHLHSLHARAKAPHCIISEHRRRENGRCLRRRREPAD